MKQIKLLIIICSLMAAISSCDSKSAHEDLENRKQSIINSLTNLNEKRENITGKDIPLLIDEYKAVKVEIENYTAEYKKRGIDVNNDELVNKINLVIKELENNIPILVSYFEAESYMENRCDEIGQTLMKSKTVHFNGTKLYMFLSVAENGYICISSISENKLEILASDCGPSEIKIEQWNDLN